MSDDKPAKPKRTAEGYDRERARSAAFQAKKSKSGRDIADGMPVVVDQPRREAARASFEFFCRTYFPQTFNLPWSNDHRTAIARIEQAAVEGGNFAYAMPRGSGKTTLAEAAAQWATLFGFRRFPVLIGSDQSSALEMLESIKTELDCNDLLLEDFPEVCYPIRCIEGIAHRCNGQLFNGGRTHLHWSAEAIVLPTIPGSVASGAIITVAGITGRIRGMKFKRPDGQSARPDLAILDDPQTDESARSPSQVAQRERLVAGAVMGLAGPGRKIAAVMPCTVIAQGDMADRLLDRKKHPEWQGERAKLVYAFPSDTGRWERYAEIRADSLRAGNGGKEATEFYRANREAMDAGSHVAWPSRHNPDDVSALQHAMNLKLDLGEAAFAAEYQNEPLIETLGDAVLTAAEIASKTNGLKRGVIPLGAEHVTAFIDVQGEVLYWKVTAWAPDFTGAIVDYGAFPDQKTPYFTLAGATRTLAKEEGLKTAGLEGRIYGGLERLVGALLAREWRREGDGAVMKIARCLIDANWGKSTSTVKAFCRRSPFAAVLMPSHGTYVGASSVPWEHFKRKEGERIGHHWMIPSVQGKPAEVRHLRVDVNFWKSFVQNRLAVAPGDRGGLTLFGSKSEDHRLVSEHLSAEYRVQTEGRGRKVDEWKIKPGRPDNHWFDCLVGCAAAASLLGASLITDAPAKPRPAPRRRGGVSYL